MTACPESVLSDLSSETLGSAVTPDMCSALSLSFPFCCCKKYIKYACVQDTRVSTAECQRFGFPWRFGLSGGIWPTWSVVCGVLAGLAPAGWITTSSGCSKVKGVQEDQGTTPGRTPRNLQGWWRWGAITGQQLQPPLWLSSVRVGRGGFSINTPSQS